MSQSDDVLGLITLIELKRRIRSARKSTSGMSLKAIQEVTGTSKRSILRYDDPSDSRQPKMLDVVRMFQHFGLSLDALFRTESRVRQLPLNSQSFLDDIGDTQAIFQLDADFTVIECTRFGANIFGFKDGESAEGWTFLGRPPQHVTKDYKTLKAKRPYLRIDEHKSVRSTLKAVTDAKGRCEHIVWMISPEGSVKRAMITAKAYEDRYVVNVHACDSVWSDEVIEAVTQANQELHPLGFNFHDSDVALRIIFGQPTVHITEETGAPGTLVDMLREKLHSALDLTINGDFWQSAFHYINEYYWFDSNIQVYGYTEMFEVESDFKFD